jgi:hypothetical protein
VPAAALISSLTYDIHHIDKRASKDQFELVNNSHLGIPYRENCSAALGWTRNIHQTPAKVSIPRGTTSLVQMGRQLCHSLSIKVGYPPVIVLSCVWYFSYK